jgi:hypothetical protein
VFVAGSSLVLRNVNTQDTNAYTLNETL